MRKHFVLFLTIACLVVSTSSMALTIDSGTIQVGGTDDLMAYTVSGNSGINTENSWAAPIVLAQDNEVVNFDVQTDTTSTDWQETNQAGVYAFSLSGQQDYFIIKTGSLYVGAPNSRPPLAMQYDTFLYRNNLVDSWAVVDLFALYGDNTNEYLNSFQVNEGKISHVTTEGGPAPVPEPSTLLLLGSGLAGLAFYRRKRK